MFYFHSCQIAVFLLYFSYQKIIIEAIIHAVFASILHLNLYVYMGWLELIIAVILFFILAAILIKIIAIAVILIFAAAVFWLLWWGVVTRKLPARPVVPESLQLYT